MRDTFLVIGAGNEFRSDDAAGLQVARAIAARSLPRISVIEQSGEGTALMESWIDSDRVILIDAVSSGAAPGTIHRMDAHREKIPSEFFHYSSHAFGVAEAVEMARALHQLPQELILYGIEGADFSAGQHLSARVQSAVDTVVQQIMGELASPSARQQEAFHA